MIKVSFRVSQIFDLLISFCASESLRSCLSRFLFSGPVPPAEQLNKLLGHPPKASCPPLVAAVCWAAYPAPSACRTAIAALDFLKEMYEVCMCISRGFARYSY